MANLSQFGKPIDSESYRQRLITSSKVGSMNAMDCVSSIDYNEKTDRFEEVPLSADQNSRAGSFMHEDMDPGIDIPPHVRRSVHKSQSDGKMKTI